MAMIHPESKRLLIVDDDPAMRESLEELPRLQGYLVLTAADGTEGLRAVHDESPDLIVLVRSDRGRRSGYAGKPGGAATASGVPGPDCGRRHGGASGGPR